jgi:para-nitrobenzyl esterase
VTINYRLGLFGWLKLPQLATGDAQADSGNFAILDQIQALRFIKANAQAFGGDPGNVTVMGQSAGAFDLWALLVAPASEGLLHKAVPLSGGLLNVSAAQAQTWAGNLLVATLLADGTAADADAAQRYIATRTPAQVAAYLRGKSAEDMVRASTRPGLGIAPAPIADGTVIPADALGAIAAGNYRAVPVLSGTTTEEGKLFGGITGSYKPNDYDRFALQYNFNPDAPTALTEADLLNPAVLPVEKPATGWNAVSANLGTRIINGASGPSRTALAAKQPGRLWAYSFDWKQEPVPFNTVYGAVHAMDVPFIMGNFDRKNIFSFAFSQANRPGREALSDAMIQSLSAFARTGNPNHPGLGTAWPVWPATLVLDASPAQARIRLAP